MASVASPRPPPPSIKYSSPIQSASRSLNRKASTISSKSDKDRPYTTNDDYSLIAAPFSPSSSHYHMSSHKSNHDASSLNGRIDELSKHRKHQYKSSVKSITSLRDDSRSKHGKGKERETRSSHGHYDFTEPQPDAIPFGNGQSTPKSRARSRPSTSNSQYDRINQSQITSFRDSGSSSLTQIETPPHTPVDDLLSLRGSLERISVYASVSGVEVMDAMVDGMNGFGADNRFLSRSLINRRSSKTERAGFHPLYQPPLPSPPPGVRLGGGIARKDSDSSTKDSDEDEDEDETKSQPLSRPHGRRKGRRPQSPRSVSSNCSTHPSQQRPADINFPKVNPSIDEIINKYAPASKSKKAVTSASDVTGSNGSTQTSSNSQSSRQVSLDGDEPVMVPLTAEEEAEFLSRSSVDSVAEEVRNTLQNHTRPPSVSRPLERARSFAHRQSVYSDSLVDMSIRSPRSEAGRDPSIYSFSAASCEAAQPVNYDFVSSRSFKPPSASQAIAKYLRSARLTTLLKLTCAPHASRDHPLTISLSDLGSSTGFPLVVFLGLGGVRHVMGLYDEMAECLGLRLITIDRWGLGRTQVPQSKLAQGIPEWSSVVAEVLDLLGIERCSIMAHSAGAPYALAFANQYRHRICGDIFLLAPWIGEGAGYKWLKYVPNGILKTAQAAEWKIQAWMLGKPPTITYEGIGFNVRAPLAYDGPSSPGTPSKPYSTSGHQDATVRQSENMRRPSIGSSVFSEYDDLRDFEGRFESRSTFGGDSMEDTRPRHVSDSQSGGKAKRKPSKGFLGRLRGASNSQPSSPAIEKPAPIGPGKRLKALKSMSSLKSKASSAPSTITRANSTSKPQLPQSLAIEVGLGLDEINWGGSRTPSPLKKARVTAVEPPPSSFHRSNGRRSVSTGTHRSSPPILPSSPSPTSVPPSPTDVTGGSYQAMLGNALIAASHAESAKGTHSDLVQILNHDRVPWGFSYSDYPHQIRVWYGDKDEKIAESAVRWLERTMGPSRCHVNVVKGADHALMYKSAVVIDVFEQVHDYARYGQPMVSSDP